MPLFHVETESDFFGLMIWRKQGLHEKYRVETTARFRLNGSLDSRKKKK